MKKAIKVILIICGIVYAFFAAVFISALWGSHTDNPTFDIVFSTVITAGIVAVPVAVFAVVKSISKRRQKRPEVQDEAPTIKEVEIPSDAGIELIHAVDVVVDAGACSVALIQRRLKLGYSNAARLVDQMEALGMIGPYEGAAPRKVLISRTEWEKMRPKEVPHYEAPVIGTDQIIKNDLQRVDLMDGPQFEWWCAGLLRKNGFSNVEVTKASNDQGVDVLAEKGGVKYAIQCKRYSSDLGNTPIQEVHAGKAFYGCHVGVVMTNQHFTKGAVELAEKTGVLLWDRDYITDLMRAAEERTSGKA